MQHGSGLLLNAYNTNNVRLNVSVTHPIHSAMRSSSSQSYTPEPSPSRKNKMQSQREYRSKEMVGFSELRDALLLVDPFDTPLGRDATRHQLLITGQSIMLCCCVDISTEDRITAAKKLRNLADENQKLAFQLSAMPNSGSHEPELGVRSSCGMTSRWCLSSCKHEVFTMAIFRKYWRCMVNPKIRRGILTVNGRGACSPTSRLRKYPWMGTQPTSILWARTPAIWHGVRVYVSGSPVTDSM